jgi:rare lipoprotein A
MITKPHFLMVTLLQAALVGPTSAAERKPDECGLAPVYATRAKTRERREDTRLEEFTAAHRTLRFGTLVNVNNQDTGCRTAVRITNRGPFVGGRIVDVSQVAARELSISGLARVCLDFLRTPESKPEGSE